MRVTVVGSIGAVLVAGLAAHAAAGVEARGVSAADAIRRAVAERLGADADVQVTSVGVTGDGAFVREARPDPAARLGKPMRFTLVTDRGAALPVTASVTVVARYAVATRDVARGATLAGEDVNFMRAEVTDVPLRRLPAARDIVGARTLRAIPAGAAVVGGMVAVARAVEPGDRVTVVAAAGDAEVTATFVAADGGDPGAIVRVVNPDTKRYLRGRVMEQGRVEVLNVR